MSHNVPSVSVFVPVACASRAVSKLNTTNNDEQLKDQSLLKDKTYVNGEWIGAKSGKTFEVHGNRMICMPVAYLSLTYLYRPRNRQAHRHAA
jgi:hypothetical protein